jgi:guanylate kinase
MPEHVIAYERIALTSQEGVVVIALRHPPANAIDSRMIEEPRLVVVVSGPSGAGKSTLVDNYVEARKTACELMVTSTTRTQRNGEVPGQDYHFISKEEFQRLKDADEFLEYAQVHDHFYGSPRKDVERTLREGKDVILEIDVQGGLAVKRRCPTAVLVFVIPSDLSDLRQRLSSRGTDTDEVIEKRLSNARREIERVNEYNYVIFNDILTESVELLGKIVDSERHRISRYDTLRLFNPELLSRALSAPQAAKA